MARHASHEIDVRWDALPRARWQRLARRPALQQSWAYGEAMAALGVPIRRAELRRGGRTVGLAQATSRRFANWMTVALAARGPLWVAALAPDEKAEMVRALIASAPFDKPRALIVSPAEETADWMRAARLRRVMTGDSTARLRLNRPDDALSAGMRGKWRNRLRAAERDGWAKDIRKLDASATAALVGHESAQRKARRYESLPEAFTAAFAAATGGKGVVAYGAFTSGELAAGMLFLRHGAAATYHLGWANDAARAGGAHNAILWRALRALRDLGVEELDMGGLDTERTPGIARFKLGAGATATQFAGSFV